MKRFFKTVPLFLILISVFCSCKGTSDQPYNENLLKNASFEITEDGKCTDWVLDRYDTAQSSEGCGGTEFVNAPDGKNVLAVTNTGFNDSRFIQEVELEPNTYYKLSAKIKTDGTEIYSAESGANISFLKTYCRSEFITGYSDWTEVVLYGKTGKKVKSATVALRLGYYSSDCSGSAYFDDVKLEKVKNVPDNVDVGDISEFTFSSSASNGSKSDGNIKLSVVLRGILYFAVLAFALSFALKRAKHFTPSVAYIIIGICFCIRVIASVMYTGFGVDINCFSAWGAKMASSGPLTFYSDGYFCDYPPLYMLVLGLVSLISPVNLNSGIGLMFLKMPAMLCDIITAVLIVKKAKKYVGENIASILGILYALLPTVILNSAVWGQVDSILALFMFLTFILIGEDKFGLSVAVYAIGLLLKPQAVLFGPVMLFAAAREFAQIGNDFKENRASLATKRLCSGFGSLLVSALIFVIMSVLMQNGQSASWLWDKYMNTISSYDYATLSSFGLMGLLGGQWVPSDTVCFFGISYGTLGTVLTLLVLLSSVVFYILTVKKQGSIIPAKYFYLLSAYTVAGIVTVSTRTHERYMFPVIIMLIASFFCFKDKRMLYLSIGYAFVNFVNTATVLYVYEECGVYMSAKEPIMLIFSAITVILFVLLTLVTADTVLDNPITEVFMNAVSFSENRQNFKNTDNAENTESPVTRSEKPLKKLFARRSFKLPKVTLKDILICGLITAIYACVAFTDLGDTKAPQTLWLTSASENYVLCDLGEEKNIDSVAINASSSGKIKIYTSQDGTDFNLAGETVHSYYADSEWVNCNFDSSSAKYVKFVPQKSIVINETVLLSKGEVITPETVTSNTNPVDGSNGDGNRLFDAQSSYGIQYKKPETFASLSGEYTFTLEEGSVLGGIYGYSDSSLGGTLEFANPLGETVAYLDIYGTSWCSAEVFDDVNLESNVYTVRINESISGEDSLSAGEIVFTDTDGKIINVISATGANIEQVLDEQETFTEYSSVKEDFDTGESFIVSDSADWVIADFGEIKHVNRGYFYTSVCSGSFEVYFSKDGENWSVAENHTVDAGDLYYWHGLPSDGGTYADLNTRYVAVCTSIPDMRIIEMGFFENSDDTSVIEIKNVTSSSSGKNGGGNIFDEQSLVPTRPSYMNSMYFDEIYHARTAYENLNGLNIYEWTHPPLGKDIMSLSIRIFGMTPFGWRFAGTLAGVLMVPAMYFVGLLMFRKRTWASLLAVIMSLDGMHFVQTRLATIDSYGVLFIILMFLFMYWYYSISFYDMPIWKTFLPLGLCGLAFGLGAASKWICLYAGAGLAVIFFITLARRYSEYRLAKSAVYSAEGEERKYLQHIIRTFPLYTAETVLFCIGAFIIVPAVIYCVSYFPYFNVEGETRAWYEIIIANQRDMFNYHSKLQATHPFQSDWYTWPIIYRPIYYYAGKELPDATTVECISSFGNPVIWYMGLVSTVFGFVVLLRRLLGNKTVKIKDFGANKFERLFSSGDKDLADIGERDTRLLIFLALGVACNLLPWVGISRCIFIYHYFATVPFIMMFTVYTLRNICRKNKKLGVALTVLFILCALVLFIMFKPIWTGTAVSKEYVRTYLRWFDSWVFGV